MRVQQKEVSAVDCHRGFSHQEPPPPPGGGVPGPGGGAISPHPGGGGGVLGDVGDLGSSGASSNVLLPREWPGEVTPANQTAAAQTARENAARPKKVCMGQHWHPATGLASGERPSIPDSVVLQTSVTRALLLFLGIGTPLTR